MHYIFDVDGTLTPSRQLMNKHFEKWFENFSAHHNVYLVTGSDRDKTLAQVGDVIYNLAKTVYNCSGNDVWKQDKNIRSNYFQLPDNVKKDLTIEANNSRFHAKNGDHFDERPGLVNFSVVGRNCSLENRFLYVQWDEHKNEREIIAEKMREKYPDLNFQVAGETGIDITLKGLDKSQILKDFITHDGAIYFFGDKMEYGGNDYELGLAVARSGNHVHQVKDWRHTWKILKELSA